MVNETDGKGSEAEVYWKLGEFARYILKKGYQKCQPIATCVQPYKVYIFRNYFHILQSSFNRIIYASYSKFIYINILFKVIKLLVTSFKSNSISVIVIKE